MPKLDPLPTGKLALKASWFRKIRDRIEEIKPLPSKYITVKNTTEGQIIDIGLKVQEIAVCKDGEPQVLQVFAPKDAYFI